MKACIRCKIKQPFTYFNKCKRRPSGYSDYCRKCVSMYYLNNKKEYLRKAKIWATKNPEKVRISARKYEYKSRYGSTIEEIEKLGKTCNICFKQLKTPHVDHCHKSKKIRGILCGSCNRGIGLLKEEIWVLNNAIEYLRRHKNDRIL